MISQQFIDQILSATDIVELVSKYLPLKRKGVRYSGLCPFHTEKTPSFQVTPSQGRYFCYGCKKGGNAINFLMEQENLDFRQAVFELARIKGIPLPEEKELTDQERKEYIHKEALFILNAKVHEFYKEHLAKSFIAQEYVKKRWDMEFAISFGIGYAPSKNVLLSYANKHGLNLDLLKELGLVRENDSKYLYDFYQDRIIIPVNDRSGRIIGFTARTLSDNKDIPKYLNSANSLIYNKHNSLFGVHTAYREAIKQDKVYLVEGAPDVLRLQMIGVTNSIASLGSSWTDSHYHQIRKLTQNICFIPDADPRKMDDEYPAGTLAVMKCGKKALEMGFKVTVREIPLGTNGEKNDPDTHFATLNKFKRHEEVDFINWYAHLKFEGKSNTEEQHTVVTEIAELIILLGDETKEDMYLNSLKDLYKEVAVWKKAMKVARRRRVGKLELERNRSIDRDFLSKYGFTIQDGGYYSFNNVQIQWSNFTMEPMFHIRDSINPKRMYRITNQNKQEEIIEMKQEDLVSLSKFRQRIEGIGNFIWEASEKELIKLKKFLYEQTETATEIMQLGYQKQGFYAFGNGIFDGSWHATDEFGIVKMGKEGNFYLPASSKIYLKDDKLFQFERRFVHLNYNTVSLREFSDKMVGVFGDNSKVGLCFLLATLFRDIIVSYTKSFPILNLFGPKGTGKSEFGDTLMSFFIIKNSAPNISNATVAAMADAVAQCSDAVVHLDEFKNSIDLDKREFLKGLWDGTGRSRMNMDRDKKREITNVDCGVIVSGQEMATADIALFSRFIFLSFNRNEYTREEKKRFEELSRIQGMGLTHLTLQILSHRAKMEQGFVVQYKACMDDLQVKLKNEIIEDRILRNWVTPLAAFRVLEPYLDFPFAYKELLPLFTDGVVRQNRECKANNELANFWNVVAFLQQEGEIFIDGDYRIDFERVLKTNKANIEFLEERPILKMRRTKIFMLYKKFGRQVGDAVLPEGSLRYYLENSKEYLGVKHSVRFKDIRKGGVENLKAMDTDSGGVEYRKTSGIDMAMCFDYNLIMENYGVDINVYV